MRVQEISEHLNYIKTINIKHDDNFSRVIVSLEEKRGPTQKISVNNVANVSCKHPADQSNGLERFRLIATPTVEQY